MKPMRSLLIAVAGLLVLLVSYEFPLSGQERVTKIPVEANGSPKASIRPYMHAKVLHSEQAFEGLVTRDFKKIIAAAEALQVTSLSVPTVEAGETRDDEVFEHFKVEFLRLSTQLEQMAEAENLHGAAYVHQQMNATCLGCHQYLRDTGRGQKPASTPASK